MAVFNSIISRRVARISVVVLGVIFAGSIAAQSRDAQIAERLRPVGEVCVAGDPCAGGAAPAQASAAPAEFSAEGTYNTNCGVCHNSGMAGAPKPGDDAAWATRLEKGMDAVVANAINGINAMPAKGMCMTCTDEQLAEVVAFMSGQ